jgi:dipeptidase
MCDTIVVVRPDRVLFAKNSDRDANEAQLLDWQPRREHAEGTTLRCTWIEIPQVRHTHAVLLSRPFWMWGAEIGANEHGVVIGNEAVFTNQTYRKTGLTGMDLLRLGLERATTAGDAVEVITSLLERHGQGGGCGHEKRSFTYHNSFLIADPSGAFLVETADRHWQAEQVDGARTISNGLTIPGFADRYSDRIMTWGSRCRVRQRLTSVAAAASDSVADQMAILRDHGDGRVAPSCDPLTGGLSAPCVHPGGLAANSQTTASWVTELHRDSVQHWVTGTSAPCTGLFKPVRVTESLNLGPAPTDGADDDSLWWRHERLHRRVMRNPDRLLPLFMPERDEIERRWLAEPPEPKAAFAEGDRLLAGWISRVTDVEVPDTRPGRLRRYWRARDRRAGLR